MTNLSDGTIATDIDANDENTTLRTGGYTIRYVQTWHDFDKTIIVWDPPVSVEDRLSA